MDTLRANENYFVVRVRAVHRSVKGFPALLTRHFV
jgi:hypothetical protein